MRNRHASGLAAPTLPVSCAGYIASASSPIRSTNKVVFAITSNGNDYYTAMTRVAVASLRLSNPALRVLVSCDRETDRSVHQVSDPLIEEVDEWLAVDTPPGDSGFRNRFVKTSLRGLIQGPFLFLDSDVFVRGDLSSIFALDTDIAGARNHSREAFAEQVWEQDAATLEAMGWTIGADVYINGGVLYWNDTDGARRFGAEWHRRWLLSFQARLNCRDQPALNSALHAAQARLTVLPDRYNAQFKVSLNVVGDASVWHYYSSICDPPHTRFEQLATDLMSGKMLNLRRVGRMVSATHPWRRASGVDDWVAARVMRRGQFNEWEAAWLRREMLQYLMTRARHASWRFQESIARSLTR